MSGRWRNVFELIRLPNVFTAAADVLAGFLFAGGSWSAWPWWMGLCAASMALYAGGVALNDVRDVERDRVERPSRVIPSGRMSLRVAAWISVLLLVSGVVLAVLVGEGMGVQGWVNPGSVALGLIWAIVLYNRLHGRYRLAPGLMGLCRALNLLLGMSAAGLTGEAAQVLPLVLMWVYVTSITVFAGQEAGLSDRGRLRAGAIGVVLGVGGLACLPWLLPDVHISFLILVGVLVFGFADSAMRAIRDPQPVAVQAAVRRFVLGIVGWDACLAWSAGGPWDGLAILLLWIPGLLLARRFRVT